MRAALPQQSSPLPSNPERSVNSTLIPSNPHTGSLPIQRIKRLLEHRAESQDILRRFRPFLHLQRRDFDTAPAVEHGGALGGCQRVLRGNLVAYRARMALRQTAAVPHAKSAVFEAVFERGERGGGPAAIKQLIAAADERKQPCARPRDAVFSRLLSRIFARESYRNAVRFSEEADRPRRKQPNGFAFCRFQRESKRPKRRKPRILQ